MIIQDLGINIEGSSPKKMAPCRYHDDSIDQETIN